MKNRARNGLVVAAVVLLLAGANVQAQTPTATPTATPDLLAEMYLYSSDVDVTKVVLSVSGNAETRIWRMVDYRYGIACYVGPDDAMQCFRIGEGK